MTNLNDQLDFALNQINPTNRAIIMNFIKGIIIPAMVQEEKGNNKPKDKPKKKKIVPPKKKETIKDNSNKSSVLGEGSNGHKAQKVRDLEDDEKDLMREKFIEMNGEIHEDYCLEIKSELSEDISIFQVTGFISYLHKEVKKRELVLSNMRSYNNFQKQKRLGNLKSRKKKTSKIISFKRGK